MTDIEPVESEDDANVSATEAARRLRPRGYDKRLEEWLASLKEEAGQRSPEVLGALAAKARDVAEYLDKMADQARSRRTPDESVPTVEASRGDELDAQ
jgi:hypothetical protein